MLSLALIAALAQSSAMPANYVGLWADAGDRLYMVGTPSYVEYVEGDQWGVVHGVYQAPNKDFVGLWMQSKTIYGSKLWSLPKSKLDWPKSIYGQYDDYDTTLVSPLIPDNVRYSGEFRMTAVAGGCRFTMHDGKGIIEKSSTMRWIGNWDQATVGGLYQDKLAKLMIRETPAAKNWKTAGSFTYDGKQYLIEGERLFTRGRVNLIDPRYGSVVGYLVYGYTPSAMQVREFRSGTWSPTDKLFINFTVPNVPTVQQRFLGR